MATQMKSLSGRAGVVERAGERDRIVGKASGKGWQVLLGVVSQEDTEKLLKAAARRMKVNIRVTKWADGTTVTFKVTPKPILPTTTTTTTVVLTPTTELEVAPLEEDNG